MTSPSGGSIRRGPMRPSRRWAAFSLVVGACLLLQAGRAPITDAQTPTIRFAESTELKLTYADGAIKPVVVVIQNGGPMGTLKVRALLSAGGTPIPPEDVRITAKPDTIGPGAAEAVTLTIEPNDTHTRNRQTYTGQLVVELEGRGAAPGMRPVTLRVQEDSWLHGPADFFNDVPALLVWPALFALGFAFLRWFAPRKDWWWPQGERPISLNALMGSATWKFTDSWASTLTAAGAVLGTVLTASLLPDDPRYFTKSGYLAINALLVAAITGAGFLFNTLRVIRMVQAKDKTETPHYFGRVVWFLLACGLVLTAVMGELIVLLIFVAELDGRGTIAGWLSGGFVVVVAALAFLAATYWWRTTGDTLRFYVVKPGQADIRDPDEACRAKRGRRGTAAGGTSGSGRVAPMLPATAMPVGVDTPPRAMRANIDAARGAGAHAPPEESPPPPPPSWPLP